MKKTKQEVFRQSKEHDTDMFKNLKIMRYTDEDGKVTMGFHFDMFVEDDFEHFSYTLTDFLELHKKFTEAVRFLGEID